MERNCDECGTGFTPKSKRNRFCSDACRYRQRDRGRFISCAACGEPLLRSGKHTPGVSVHRACQVGGDRHGRDGEYRDGCRCERCIEAHNNEQRAWGRKEMKRTGLWRRGTWIAEEERRAIYERDDWTCQLCKAPVDEGLPHGDPMEATLDHIVPLSTVLLPDHSPENLRLTHRVCNQRRGNRT